MRIKLLFAAAVVIAIVAGIPGAPASAAQDETTFQPAEAMPSVLPVYPINAVNPGTVVLNVALDASGKIQDVRVVRAAAGFTAEAVRAVKQWSFRPARLEGRPVASIVPVVVSFAQPLPWKP